MVADNDYLINKRAGKPLFVIKPKTGLQVLDLKEFTQYYDLFYFLIARYLQIRYKQTILGGLWAIIQPLFLMLVFSLFFGYLAKVPSDGIPYPLFNFSALVIWTYFANAITLSGFSLVENNMLLTKVYFPRLLIPLAPIIASLLDFAIAFFVLLIMMLLYGIYPNISVLLVIPLLLIVILTACGVGSLLAALNAKYRDIRYVIPLLLQVWMFASPVVYPVSLVPEKYQMLYAINPMTGVIEGFRSILFGSTQFPMTMVFIAAGVSVVLFFIGILYFKQTERYFADVV